MISIKKQVSFNPLVFQALEASRKALGMSRSKFLEKALENYPDFDDVYEGIKEANKAVNNE